MKKIFLFAAAAMVSLSSCVQTSEVYTGKLNEMGFKSAVTRGIIQSQTDMTYPIVVSAVVDSDVLDGTDDYIPYFTNTDPLAKYDNAMFAYDELTHLWAGSPARYWPSTGHMQFLAFCPSPTNATLKTNYNPSTGKIENITVTQIDNNIINQHDILYSDLLECDAPQDGAQALTFHHALSQINVVFKKTDSPAKVTLKSVMLEDVFFAGNLVITPNEGAASTAVWTTPGEAFLKSRNFNKQEATSIEDIAIDKELSNIEGYSPVPLLVVPMDHQGKILVAYSIEDKVQTYELDLTTNGEKWEMGKKYTYTFTINVNEIIFDCDVDEWVPGNGDGGQSIMI